MGSGPYCSNLHLIGAIMASHKADVAVSVPHRVRAILMHRGLGWHTSHTIVNLPAKEPTFVEVRRQGYAVDDVGFEEGVHFVGASVVEGAGRVSGAMG
jgi:DNA-binding IclR family transcriptional regulator